MDRVPIKRLTQVGQNKVQGRTTVVVTMITVAAPSARRRAFLAAQFVNDVQCLPWVCLWGDPSGSSCNA